MADAPPPGMSVADVVPLLGAWRSGHPARTTFHFDFHRAQAIEDTREAAPSPVGKTMFMVDGEPRRITDRALARPPEHYHLVPRRRAAKGWRKHVRRMKAEQRRNAKC